MSKIWEKYLFQEAFKVFALCLSCFFFLYVLIDSSLHLQDFMIDRKLQFKPIALYYAAQFVKRCDLLIPLSLLVATLKVLLSMQKGGELIALQVSGLSARRLLRPLFMLGLLGALFNWGSAQWLLPSSLKQLDKFRKEHFKHPSRHAAKEPVHVLTLKDRSKLLYQEEDAQVYKEVFWIRSADDLWHMRTLSKQFVGRYVDHLQRDQEGRFQKTESFDRRHFPHFHLEENVTGKGVIPLENRSLSELSSLSFKRDKASAYERPQAQTHLLFKLTMPLLSILVIIAGAPYCFRYARTLPIFFIYATALFGFVTFFAFMDAAVILGENLTLFPVVAIVVPFALCAWGFGRHYYKKLA